MQPGSPGTFPRIKQILVLALLLVSFALLAQPPHALPAFPEPTRDLIARWVKQLGDDEFEVREQAMQRLAEAAEDAESALEEAAKSDDLEVARRARELLELLNEPGRIFLGHSDRVWGVSFSPDGSRLASGSCDRTVKVWNARTGQELLSLTGHSDNIRSVCFSPDGRRVATAGDDGTVRIWPALKRR